MKNEKVALKTLPMSRKGLHAGRLVASALCLTLAMSTAAKASLVINEVMYDPTRTGDHLDANGDGAFSGSTDEFTEFVNDSLASLDISGYTVSDSASDRITFPAGTVLAAGQALVLFNGGTPVGSFGGALVLTTATSGWLSNGGDTVSIRDASNVAVASYTYAGGELGASLVRDPDLTGAFTDHESANAGAGVRMSPGFHNDGTTPFAVPEPASMVLFAAGAGLIGAVRRR